MIAIEAAYTDSVLSGIDQAWQSYLATIPQVTNAPEPVTSPLKVLPPMSQGGGGLTRSDEWWHAISVCESGDTNGWRTGFLGLEGRPGISSLSYEDQREVARGIYAQYGDGAWGCAPNAWAAVPAG